MFRKKNYWSLIGAMLGVALVAAAVFAKEDWGIGMSLGVLSILVGAKLAKED